MEKDLTILYHYTSFEAFKNIIENKTIRLSDLTKSNDTAEIYGLWNSSNKTKYDSSFNPYNFNWFGFCLSELEDDLHMWNCYGNHGIAIGFAEDEINQLIEKLRDDLYLIQAGNESNLQKVNYNLQTKNVDYDSINDDIFFKSAFCKSNFFSCEKEWRLILPVNKMLFDKKTKIKFNINSIDIEFDANAIRKIIIAPNCLMPIESIKKLLNDNQISAEVIKSKGTLR